MWKSQMTRSQKAALRFAYDVLCGRYKNQAIMGMRVIATNVQYSGLWLEPDKDPERDYLNEALFATLVVSGYLECREFPPNKLWLYRITPEGCTAIGKVYPGIPPNPQTLPRKLRKQQDSYNQNAQPPDHRDPHRFRRSNDWRKC